MSAINVTLETANIFLREMGYESIEQFRKEYGLNHTGPIDERDLRAMAIKRCGVRFGQARGSTTKLHTNRPKVFVRHRLTNSLLRDKFDEKLLAGLNMWSKVADIQFSLTNIEGDAQIEVQTKQIDGPANTLAFAYFPQGAGWRLPLVFDTAEAWEEPSGPDFECTACHEGGHNCGIDHDPTAQGIMAAFYNPRITVPTSTWEINEMVSRYGKPVPVTPSQPPTPPTQPPVSKRRVVITGENLRIEEFQ